MTEIYSRVFILKDLQAHLQFLIEPFNPSIHPSESLSLMDLQHPRFQVWIGFSCEVWNGDPVVQYFTFKSPSSRPSSSGLYKFKLKAILSLMYPDSQRLKIKRKSTNWNLKLKSSSSPQLHQFSSSPPLLIFLSSWDLRASFMNLTPSDVSDSHSSSSTPLLYVTLLYIYTTLPSFAWLGNEDLRTRLFGSWFMPRMDQRWITYRSHHPSIHPCRPAIEAREGSALTSDSWTRSFGWSLDHQPFSCSCSFSVNIPMEVGPPR